MNTENNPNGLTVISWKPQAIAAIEVSPTRDGLIGRATPMVIGGVEVFVFCRSVLDVKTVYETINANAENPPPFNEDEVARVTLISSVGVEVTLEPEEPQSVTTVDASASENAFAAKVDTGTPFAEPAAVVEAQAQSADAFEAVIDTPVDDDEL